MKTRTIILAILALAAISCAKHRADVPAMDSGMSFTATNGGASKSYFQDISQSGQLVWDSEDILGVWSIDPAAADPYANIISGQAYINQNDHGKTSARFTSVLTKDEWFADVDGTQKWFFAYYPCLTSDVAEIQKLTHRELVEEEWVETETKYVFPVFVDNNQFSSQGFSKNHVLYTQGTMASKGDVINLGTFTPYTALIRFRMKSTNAGYNWTIGELHFTYGYENATYGYLSSDPGQKLAGAHLLEVSASERSVTPSPISLLGDGWKDDETIYYAFMFDDKKGVEVKTDEYTNYYYMAVLPTLTPRNDMKIRIEASGWNLFEEDPYGTVFRRVVDAPAELANGFQSGKCYSFAINFDEGDLSIGYEGSNSVGAYDINTGWGDPNSEEWGEEE